MICIITDVRDGEPDILTPIRHQTLRVTTLEGVTLATVPAPAEGWTHASLTAAVARLPKIVTDEANAYLGDEWVGSTEV